MDPAELRNLFDGVAGFAVVLSPEGEVVVANAAALAAAGGVAHAEVRGAKLWATPLISGGEGDEARARTRAREAALRAAAGSVVRVELPVGALRAAELRFAPVRDDAGRVTAIVVSGGEPAAGAARESEDRFRIMADGLPHIVWVHDRDGEQEFVNRTFCEFFGVRSEEMRGERWRDLMHPDDAAGYTEAFLAATGERRPFHAEVRVRRQDGEWRWIESWGQPRFAGDGEFEGFVGTSVDVTDRKRAEARLRESEARYRELVEHANSAIIRWRRDGTVLFFNEHAERLFGWSAKEIRGRHISVLLPDGEAAVEGLVDALVERPEGYREHANVNVSRDGRRIWMLWTNHPILDEDGRAVEILAVGSDVSKLKAAEDALREADRRKDRFLATLAHELRNPLAPLLTGLELLRLSRGEPDVAERTLGMMERQVTHVVRLVDDLMEVSRISRGKISLRRERLDLRDSIRNAVETCRASVPFGERRLAVDLPDEPLFVSADAVRVVQVVANLLGNAVKYTDEAGAIRIEARRENGAVRVTVGDDGIGIAPAELERVFEMFVQAGSGHGAGLGIGLTLARSLVELHGGTLEARSEGPGRGSEFVVRLPSGETKAAGAAATPHEERVAAGLRVLVADDNHDAAESLGVLLGFLGADVRVVNDGRHALEAAAEFAPDVILLDLGMPVLDGYEVARRLRARGDRSRIVAVTGWSQAEDRRQSAEAGFDRHLTKPVGVEELKSVLRPRD